MELQNAAKEDHAAALGAEQAKKLSALRIEAKQLDLEELKEEKEELRILMENRHGLCSLRWYGQHRGD